VATRAKAYRWISVNEATHDRINELASQVGVSPAAILDVAIDRCHRDVIFGRAADAWNTIGEELLAAYMALEGAIADGLQGAAFESAPEPGKLPN
jgi:hypothetical protein